MNSIKGFFLSLLLLILIGGQVGATPKTYNPIVKKLKNEAHKHFQRYPPLTEKSLHSSLDQLIWENSNEIIKKYNIQPTDEKLLDEIRIQLAIELIKTNDFTEEVNGYLTSYGQRFRMELVDVLMEMNKYDLAITTLKELKEDFPYDGQVQYLLGECYKNSGDAREAANFYSEAAGNESFFGDALYNEGLMLMDLGVYEKADAALISAISSDSTNIQYRMTLASSYASQMRYDESLAQFEDCIRLDSTNYDAYALMVQVAVIANDAFHAKQYASPLMVLSAPNAIQNIALGDYYWFTKQYNAADVYYSKALKDDISRCDYWKRKIKNAQCFSEVSTFRTILVESLHHCGDESNSYYILSSLNFKDKLYKEALVSIDNALLIDRQNANYYELKGDIFVKIGFFHHASDAYQAAVKLKDDDSELSQKLDDALMCSKGTRRQEIKEVFVF